MKNYIQVMELRKSGKTWWSAKMSFNNFAKSKTIQRFLPDYFDLESFNNEKKKNGSAVEQSVADEKVEVNF